MSAFASVILALVFAFMGPTRFHHDYGIYGRPVDLPKASHFEMLQRANREDGMFVAITHDGRIWFPDHQIRIDDLPRDIDKQLRAGAERRVYVSADARAKYGLVMQVLDAIEATGVQDVAFLVMPRPVANVVAR